MTSASARRGTLAALTTAALLIAGAAFAAPASARPGATATAPSAMPTVRVATYNLSLNRAAAGQLVADLSTGTNAQARTVAEVIQRTNPDVVLLNEFDYVAGDVAATSSATTTSRCRRTARRPVEYPYAFVAPSNTGIPSGFDLNNDGTVGGPDDALGFGFFEGQYGMAVLSKYPIATEDVRTFQNFLWKDMPGALLPDDLATRRAGRLVHACGARGRPAVEQVALGRPRAGRKDHDPRARLAPHTADVRRRRRTATAGATTTRSGSGRTTSLLPKAATSSTTQVSKVASIGAIRS